MLITTTQANEVTKLAVTMFSAAPGAYKAYLDGVYMDNGADLVATATALGNEPAFAAMYNGTAAENAAKIISNLSLDAITDSALKTLAETYITDQVNLGADLATLYGFALDYMANNTDGNDFSEALAVIDAQVVSANAFTAGHGKNVTDLDVLMQALVDGNDGTFASLTVEQDAIFGNSADNAFKAFLSADLDTLQSGDYINGGAGTDTLNVTLANSPYAIIAETVGVEKMYVQSQADGNDEGDNEVQEVTYGNEFGAEFSGNDNTIDAQLMTGMNEFWSTESRADLVIEDIRNNSHETTIGWQAADPGDVDYAVFFTPTAITKPSSDAAGAQLFLELLDLDSMALGNGPLTNNPYIGVVVTIGGVEVEVIGDAPITTTYAAIVQGFNDSLAAQGYTTVTASLGVEFDKFNSDDGQLYTGTTIVLTNTGAEELGAVGWTTGGAVLPPDTNIHTHITDVTPAVQPHLTQTDIILDWVGRDSKAGDFIAGNMSTGNNSDSQGIQQFNVDVDRNSWIDAMLSTNNTLEVVNVENIGANGSLQIDKLNDVRVFDSSAMVGDVTLTAHLSDGITAKYLDLTDVASDSTADNSEVAYATVVDKEFSYDLGQGDDELNLTVDHSNMVNMGSVTREDFKLEVTGGAGDDSISFSVMDGAGALAASGMPWFTNHEAYVDNNDLSFNKSNVKITAGTGDDTVMTKGAGSFDITTGSGNDTIYSDNAGTTAQWIVNAASFTSGANPADVVSQALTDQLLYKATLTVTFSGAATTAQGVSGIGGASLSTVNGFESSVTIPTFNYLASQAEVNQAIKAAINEDAVLSKLLVAKDGPADTLVIDTLVDGVFDPTDLEFGITAATLADLTASEQVGLQSAFHTMNSDSTTDAVQVDLDNAALAMLAEPGYAAPAASFAGTASTFENNNIIEAGTGDDVIVLSTDAASNEVLVFNGAFGNDTVLNFNDADLAGLAPNAAGADVLDFTTHLNNVTSVSTSTESQVDAATAATNTLVAVGVTLDANDFTIITDFVSNTVSGETWSAMTAANLLAAVIDGNTTSYANIVDGTLDAGVELNTVGTTSNSVVMIENDANAGEYKVFEINSTVATTEFTAATLLGTIDFGASIDGTTVTIA